MSHKVILLTLFTAVAGDICPSQKLVSSVEGGTTRLTCPDLQASYSVNGEGRENLRIVYSGEALKRFSVGIEKPLAMARLAETI